MDLTAVWKKLFSSLCLFVLAFMALYRLTWSFVEHMHAA